MTAPRWWPLVTVLKAMAHCLVSHEDADLTNSESQDSRPGPALPCHRISVGNIDFAFNLYKQLALDAPEENILISPVIISSALAKLFLGAPAANRTELLEGLGFNLTVLPEAEIQEGFQDLSLRLPAQDPQLLLTMGQRTFHGLGGGGHPGPHGGPETHPGACREADPGETWSLGGGARERDCSGPHEPHSPQR